MEVDSRILEKIDRQLEKQNYTNLAFFIYSVAVSLWGISIGTDILYYFYFGFGLWILGFAIFIVGVFKTRKPRKIQ